MEPSISVDPETGMPCRSHRFDQKSLAHEEKWLQAACSVVCAYLTGNEAVHNYITQAYAGYGIDTYSGCVRTFAKGTPIVLDEVNDPEGFGGDAFQQCASLESTFGLTYPFVFTEGPGAPFPLFEGANRAQCADILFALHATGVVLGGE